MRWGLRGVEAEVGSWLRRCLRVGLVSDAGASDVGERQRSFVVVDEKGGVVHCRCCTMDMYNRISRKLDGFDCVAPDRICVSHESGWRRLIVNEPTWFDRSGND